jgi:predicted MFS family arabinose efflux permease
MQHAIGVVLAQAGFAIGATIGGISIGLLGVRMLPLIALFFVLGAIAIAAPLRQAVRRSHDEHADEQAS